MRQWRRWLPVLILAVILMAGAWAVLYLRRGLGPPKPNLIPVGDYSYVAALADHRLRQLRAQQHIPGLSAVLIVDQDIVWQASYGLANIEQGTPVSENTVFKAWSLAKPFTALEIMRLVEEGMIDLDAPITAYLPGLTLNSRFPDGEPITVRRLLTHRSGLPRNSCIHEDEWHFAADALERAAESLHNCFLAYPTGSRYHYSNIGYILLGYIVQNKRGQIFPPYMREQLFEPLGMTQSAFWSEDLPPGSRLGEGQQAVGYAYDDGEQIRYEQYDIANIPSSNLYGTAADLAAFVRFIFRGGEVGGEQLISPATLAMMFTEQERDAADTQHMGLGWKIGPALRSDQIVFHDGGPSEGTGALIAMIPGRNLGVVLLANSTRFESSLSMPIAVELLQAMLETVYGLPAVEPQPAAPYAPQAADLAGFAGDYAVMGQMMAVNPAGDRLQATISGLSFDLLPVSENRFRASHWLYDLGLDSLLPLPTDLREIEVQFQPGGEAGQEVMVVNYGNISGEIAPRYPPLPGGIEAWGHLAGVYDRYGRLVSGEAGAEKLGQNEISIVDGRLQMSGGIGPIAPLDERTILILSGPFAGETIARDPAGGVLYHQGFVYKPQNGAEHERT